MERLTRHVMRFVAPWATLSLAAVVFVGGCKKDEQPLPTPPAGPDPEVTKLMNPDKSSDKAASPNDFKPMDIIPPPPPVAATTPTTPTDVTLPTSSPTESKPASADSAVDVRTVDFAGFQKEIESLKGKIVVIDCWATWCSICKEKFPKFLELKKQYADRSDMTFASLANDPADKIEDVKEFLTKSSATFTSFLLDEDPADFAQHFQVNGVPAYLVYSASGDLIFKTGKIEELTIKLAELVPPKS